MAATREPQVSQGREEGRLQRAQNANLERPWRREPFDVFASPFSLMRRMHEDMDRLFGNVWGGGRNWPAFSDEEGRTHWTPAVEAFHRGNEFVVRADIPGLKREDLTVEVNDDSVTLQGERKYDHEEEREGIYQSERSYGRFCRVVPLPEGAVTESAKANFKNGVLEVVVQAPSHETRRGRRIEIGQESTEKSEPKTR